MAYAGSASLNVKYLMAENEQQLAKNLQAARKEAEQLQPKMQNGVSTLGVMRTTILSELLSLGETMWKVYDGFVKVHEVVVRLHGL